MSLVLNPSEIVPLTGGNNTKLISELLIKGLYLSSNKTFSLNNESSFDGIKSNADSSISAASIIESLLKYTVATSPVSTFFIEE